MSDFKFNISLVPVVREPTELLEGEIEPLKKYPEWRQVMQEFLDSDFKPGDIIPHEWFWKAFGIEEKERNTLLYVRGLYTLFNALLKEHCIYLLNEYSVGYRWIPPQQQTVAASMVLAENIQKDINRGIDALTYIHHEELTREQRAQNADRLAKLGAFSMLARKSKITGGTPKLLGLE